MYFFLKIQLTAYNLIKYYIKLKYNDFKSLQLSSPLKVYDYYVICLMGLMRGMTFLAPRQFYFLAKNALIRSVLKARRTLADLERYLFSKKIKNK